MSHHEDVYRTKFLQSYQQNPSSLKTLGGQNVPPYGFDASINPRVRLNEPEMQTPTPPRFLIKATIIPEEVNQENGEAPKYMISMKNSQTAVTSELNPGQSAIAHAGDVSERPITKCISIYPNRIDDGDARGANGMQLDESDLVQSNANPTYVNLYSGTKIADPRKILKTMNNFSNDQNQNTQNMRNSPQFSTVGKSQSGLTSRKIPNPVITETMEVDESKSKMYSWITPRVGLPAATSGDDMEEQSELTQQHIIMEQDIDQIFAQASHDLERERIGIEAEIRQKEQENVEEKDKIFFISTPTDDALGLPENVRPSVVYGGVQYTEPVFAGQKKPLSYKLHAIEVHQYVPLPESKKPLVLQSKIDPATNSLFGPMPLPFSPVHTGLVAPTFQHALQYTDFIPTLSPEVARMFNHEYEFSRGNIESGSPAN